MMKQHLIILILLTISELAFSSATILPNQGTTDFTNWSWQEQPTAQIKGKWIYFADRLIDPKTVSFKTIKQLPHVLVDHNDKVSEIGTYAIILSNLSNKHPMAIKVNEIWDSYTVFVVDDQGAREIGGLGIPSQTKQGSTPQIGEHGHSTSHLTAKGS